MIQILINLNRNVKLIDYFETLPSSKRIAKNTIWGNFIIKKFEQKILYTLEIRLNMLTFY